MKKISLFIMSIFAVGVTLAQTSDDWNYEPITADNNMSVAFSEGTLSDFAGKEIKGYAVKYIYAGIADAILGIPPIDSLTVPTSATAIIADNGSGAIPIMGMDDLCGCNQAAAGDLIRFFIATEEGYVTVDLIPEVIYAGNALFSDFSTISFNINGSAVVFGCTDAAYLEFDASANVDDGTCATLIVEGCMESSACNYDASANETNSSCVFADDVCEVCEDGAVALYDVDGDGYCDLGSGLSPEEILGSTVFASCNYDASATEEDNSGVFADEDCEICEDGAVALYDADGDGYCDLGSGLSPEEIL
ncbi:MAG: hypothetical protein QMC03_05415, partial [Flavobacteriales bacterium]